MAYNKSKRRKKMRKKERKEKLENLKNETQFFVFKIYCARFPFHTTTKKVLFSFSLKSERITQLSLQYVQKVK